MRQWLLGLVLLTLCICRAGEGECSLRVEARTTTGGKLATGVEQIGLTANGGKGTLTVDGAAKTGDEPLALDTTALSDGWHEFALTEDGATETRNLLVLNGANVAIHGGTLKADETWSADKIHIVRNWVRGPEGITLTIGDNAILKFCDATGIQVDGTLKTGTGIVLTSITDDSIGGDTDMDGGISTESVNYQLTGNVTQYTYALTVSGGTGSGRYLPQAKIMITATRDDGEPFHSWKVMGMTLSEEQKRSNPLVITMPEQDVSIEALYGYGYAAIVENGSGSGAYTDGSCVYVEADAAPDGKAFQKWIAEGVELTDKQKTTANMSFTMPDNDVKLMPHYGYAVTVTGGSGAGVFDAGDTVTVQATVPADKTFHSWSATGLELTDEQKRSNPLTFIMPEAQVELNGRLGYQLTVINGIGSGFYAAGDDVWVRAIPKEKQTFKYWRAADVEVNDDGSSYIGDTGYSNEQLSSAKLQIKMPGAETTLTAVMNSEITITDFKVVPRWPWSGVIDVTYSIECPDPNQEIYCYFVGMDNATGKSFILGKSGGVKAGGPYKRELEVDEDDFNSATFRVVLCYSKKYVTPIAPARKTGGSYVVIDLSGGPDAASYPVRYTTEEPDVCNDTCRTTELWLRRIEPGTFTMGSSEDEVGRDNYSEGTQHKVTLTKPFYIGVFECTQRQWELVMGERPSYFSNSSYYATRPVEQVSYWEIRGDEVGAGWPENGHAVDSWSFMGKLQAKTGLTFDLPTEAQWEYACRARTISALNSGENLQDTENDYNLKMICRYYYSGGWNDSSSCSPENGTAKVGSYRPNNWNLYDMHGNVWEWCLDWYESYYSSSAVTDPVGAEEGSYRVIRGGSWGDIAGYCRSASRNYYYPSNYYYYLNCNYGFRVALHITK